MTRISRATISIATAALFATACTLALLRVGESADPVADGKLENPAAHSFQYKGANYCSGCHSPSNENKLPQDWVLLNEFPIWDQHDRHRHAFEALTCRRAKQIERLMGMPADKPATKDERCLACHSLDLSHGDAGKLLGEPGSERRQTALAQGVSCEACHGASSEWFGPHSEPALWRDKDHERMEGTLYNEFGMTNLRDPVKRTELCLSCHLGDIGAGKFVTHEMYAAGHPPLPAFEIEAFCERMPRHWQLDSQRKTVQKGETDAAKKAGIDKILEQNRYQPFGRSKAVLLEGLVTLRASIKLLANQTDPRAAANADKDYPHAGLADFALYDCAACHHELRIPSQRQERGYFGGAPGRPPLKYWSLPLAELGSARATKGTAANARSSNLEAVLAPLHAAIRSRPFGDAAWVHAASVKAIEQIGSAIAVVEKDSLDAKAARRLVAQLCELGQLLPLDFDSARLVVGALDTLVAELTAEQAAAPTAAEAIAALKQAVHLDHPPAPFKCDDDAQTGTADAADFDSFAFSAKLKPLAAALGPP